MGYLYVVYEIHSCALSKIRPTCTYKCGKENSYHFHKRIVALRRQQKDIINHCLQYRFFVPKSHSRFPKHRYQDVGGNEMKNSEICRVVSFMYMVLLR